jgi:hypothetical protein
MTKQLTFDLEFKKDGIVALTDAGVTFLSLYRDNQDLSHAYRTATGYGLHVRFETADIRDRIARVPIS